MRDRLKGVTHPRHGAAVHREPEIDLRWWHTCTCQTCSSCS